MLPRGGFDGFDEPQSGWISLPERECHPGRFCVILAFALNGCIIYLQRRRRDSDRDRNGNHNRYRYPEALCMQASMYYVREKSQLPLCYRFRHILAARSLGDSIISVGPRLRYGQHMIYTGNRPWFALGLMVLVDKLGHCS